MHEPVTKKQLRDPREADLAARAAWLHFVGGLTQSDVAKRLDVPTTRAHRYIARAQAEGLVRTYVDVSSSECVTFETNLMETFGLSMCRVAMEVPETGPLPLRALSAVGGDYLMNLIGSSPHRVIGIGHGRTITAAVDAMGPVRMPDVIFVSMLGGLTRSYAANPYDVIHRLARRTGADSYMLPAPMFADNSRDKQVMMAQSGIAATMALLDRATLAIIGIGALKNDGGALNDAAEIATLKSAGASAEVLGQFIHTDGTIMETEHDGCVMAPALNSLRGRDVVAIAGGVSKVDAIRATLKNGLLTGLITDEATARDLVNSDGGTAIATE